MPVDGAAAAQYLRGFDISDRAGACLYWVWQAYDKAGADTHLTAHTALQAYNLTLGRHTDRTPPLGAAVWLGVRSSDGNRDGDVVISLGGGMVVATDQPVWGRVGVCTIAEREKLTGRPYLGWTDHIFDAPISLPAPASIPTTEPARVQEEEDEEMARAGFQFKATDGKLGSLVVDTSSGFYHEWYSNGAAYNQAAFAGFGIQMKDVVTITKTHRDALLKDAKAARG